MVARSFLLRRPTPGARPARRTSSVVAALAALAPRLVRLAHHGYPDRLLTDAARRARLPAARGADRAGARARACGGAPARARARRRAPPPRAHRRPARLPARRRRARPERHARDPGSGVRAAAERRAPPTPPPRRPPGAPRVGGARGRRGAPCAARPA